MLIHLVCLVVSIVAGFFASDWYFKSYSWKHHYSRLWAILIFIVVMNVVGVALDRIL